MSDHLKALVANSLRIPVEEVNDSLAFDVLPQWDSMNHIALMLSLEAEYGVTIGDEQVLELTSYPAIRDFIETATADRGGQ